MPTVALAYIQMDILSTLQRLLGIAVFVGLSWLASLLYKSGRRSRPSLHAQPLDDSWLQRPTPGEIWWANVPFADGTGAKIRPCLVVRTHPDSVEVLKITSQGKGNRWDHVRIPTADWDPRAKKDSWIELSRTYSVTDYAFRNRAANTCNAWVWNQVTSRHETGWVYANERTR
jgi:PemK-like, MazF-like toxin of type II toxin-antitoxin system